MNETTNFYGLDALVTVRMFRGDNARNDYKQAYGKQAPPFNPAKPVKRWQGSPSDSVFSYYVPSGVPGSPLKSVRIALAPGEAETVNLPGAVEYSPRVVAPSGAYIVTPSGEKQYINPAGLSTQSEALAVRIMLMEAGWSPSEPEASEVSGPVQIAYENTETRRFWNINTPRGSFSVGLLLRDRYTKGVDSPGRWSKPEETNAPIWYSNAETGTAFSPFPEVPAPMRELRPDERVETSPFGVRIYPNAGGSGDGTAREIFSMSAKLAEMDAKLDTLIERSRG